MSTSRVANLLKNIFIGRARDLSDRKLFHKVSLVAVLAWVGLGADGLSSSCYGPEEAFKTLGSHAALAPFVALAAVATISIICASYSHIIEVFPGGGGGYLVASKLLSPAAGVVSGCALLVDYVLTIAISVASGADQLFSLLPAPYLIWKLPFSLVGVALLTMLNLRGVRESVVIWVPVFFLFLGTHAFAILFAIVMHLPDLSAVYAHTTSDIESARMQLGWMGTFFLLIRAYSVGAGTYTGIEAVSNGLPILREPRVETGKRTMKYMGISLASTVAGLLLAYLLYQVVPHEGKTLNAVLFDAISQSWPPLATRLFVSAAMLSATALLFIAAQAGFLDGPRVLANMALDRWFPARFATLSDRFVAQNGVLLMGISALIVLFLTRGAVTLLVVLYSINVFITFTLSQLGMVRHWWNCRADVATWKRKLTVNGIGFCLTAFILVMLSMTKFSEGGWVTLLATGLFCACAFLTHAHYLRSHRALRRLDQLVSAIEMDTSPAPVHLPERPDSTAKTAVVLVNGFNGLGLHTLLAITRMFPGVFRNFVFVQVGVVDSGNFKGSGEIENLKQHVQRETNRYVDYINKQGFFAEGITGIGTDVVETSTQLVASVAQRYSNMVVFGGQIVFNKESRINRLLHNFAVFAMQREFFRAGIPFLIVPIRA